MAPTKSSKQGLLCLSDFFKKPLLTVVKQCKKIERESRQFITGKARVDPKKKRLAEEKELQEGSEEWRRVLVASGVENVDQRLSGLLYKSNGCNPPIPTAEEVDDVGEEIHLVIKDSGGSFVDTIDDV